MFQLKTILCICAVLLLNGCNRSLEPGSWVMIDVTEATKQADAHLLVFGNNHYDLIDDGFSGLKIIPFLKRHGIEQIKNVFITHPHKDHYGGTLALLEAGIKIENFWINVPSQSFCDTEKPWGCDYDHIQSTLVALKSKGVRIQSMKAKQILDESPLFTLQALTAYQDVNSPTGRQGGINDTSVLMRLSSKNLSVLFTGDLNIPLGAYLASHGDLGRWKADLIKVPHHGTEGCAPNEFFDRVGARFAFIPAPESLWNSDRSKRIREYWLRSGAEIYVSGIVGDVETQLTGINPKIQIHSSFLSSLWQKIRKVFSHEN